MLAYWQNAQNNISSIYSGDPEHIEHSYSLDVRLTLGCNVCHVLVDVSDELLTYRYVVADAELVIYCLPRHSLLFLDDGENLVAFASQLKLADGLT